MKDQQLLDAIRQSAEPLTPPESLAPEQIAATLSSRTVHAKRTRRFSPARAASAAAVLLFCCILSVVTWNGQITSKPAPSAPKEASARAKRVATAGDSTQSERKEKTPRQNAGSLYTVAKSYDQLYEILKAADERIAREEDLATGAIMLDGGMETSATKEFASDASDASAAKKYSSTNLQTQGVDESDLIKTDGRYIYTASEQGVAITDTAGGGLQQAGTIRPTLNASDSILEFYVDHTALLLLIQRHQTSLTTEATVEEPPSPDMDDAYLQSSEAHKMGRASSFQQDAFTELCIYDISDPAAPVLSQTMTQDGYYHTSRKIGDIFYLFTTDTELMQSVSTEYAKRNGCIPLVNETAIPYDRIYLPERGSMGLVLSSLNIKEPKQVIDSVMIVHDYVDVYVGTDSIYLYHAAFQNDEALTQIAKFQMENGIINAVNAAAVPGTILDTFAIHESRNTLRVLTTCTDGQESDNRLYLFDEGLQLTGSLTGIARGEQIYAARYLEDTVYFITYRNTDPLFAADLSDPTHPILLGALEITGFSEYLHFWENGTLLGLGYETDPDTGETQGLKLVMFDISNPTEPKMLDSLVMKDFQYSPALYNYKCILADPGQNLIGFAAESYLADEYLLEYDVFAWENGRFTQKWSEPMPERIAQDAIRGLYIEDTFYIADAAKIRAFSMSGGFEKIAELEIGG